MVKKHSKSERCTSSDHNRGARGQKVASVGSGFLRQPTSSIPWTPRSRISMSDINAFCPVKPSEKRDLCHDLNRCLRIQVWNTGERKCGLDTTYHGLWSGYDFDGDFPGSRLLAPPHTLDNLTEDINCSDMETREGSRSNCHMYITCNTYSMYTGTQSTRCQDDCQAQGRNRFH